ncbi:MAG: hypothetical protein GVY36_16120 [Verrucomicrobia bacterium]|jgi:hypothetical protein|nr:hypothetical protein [Verrucomicrobiota bacterium]
MTDAIERRIREWNDEEMNEVNQMLQVLEQHLYREYLPTKINGPNFWRRLDAWLGNVEKQDSKWAKRMFKFSTELFFVGSKESEEAMRYSYQVIAHRWLSDQVGCSLLESDGARRLQTAVERSWFLPVTDSLDINRYHHLNRIPHSIGNRTNLHAAKEGDDCQGIARQSRRHGIEHIVLVEDFVASGSQAAKAILSLMRAIPGMPILFAPLVVCPAGDDYLNRLSRTYLQFHYEPVLRISRDTLITEEIDQSIDKERASIREIAEKTYDDVSDGRPPGPEAPYHPLGFPANNPTGGVTVLFSNTPDNTLPMIHHESRKWTPLFVRDSRKV